MKHEILHGQLNHHRFTITTHHKVFYNHVEDEFIVEITKSARVVVYGLNQFSIALQIADIDWEKLSDE